MNARIECGAEARVRRKNDIKWSVDEHDSVACPRTNRKPVMRKPHSCICAPRAAFRNSKADPTNSIAKTAWRPNTAATPLAKAGVPMINAIAGTSTIANAVANNARDIPCGSKRAMTAPMNPTRSTPKYIMFAGSSPRMPPTAAFIQTRRNTAASATPTANRYVLLLIIFFATSPYVRPAPPNRRTRAKTKAPGLQYRMARSVKTEQSSAARLAAGRVRWSALFGDIHGHLIGFHTRAGRRLHNPMVRRP